jgi:hypothetical protein
MAVDLYSEYFSAAPKFISASWRMEDGSWLAILSSDALSELPDRHPIVVVLHKSELNMTEFAALILLRSVCQPTSQPSLVGVTSQNHHAGPDFTSLQGEGNVV